MSEQELIEAKVTPLHKKTERQIEAERKHQEKIDTYRNKKIDEIHEKVSLGVMQIVGSMKKLPWCARVAVCTEILFNLKNKNYGEAGEWIGDPDEEHRAPWCVRLGWSRKK